MEGAGLGMGLDGREYHRQSEVGWSGQPRLDHDLRDTEKQI